MIPSFLSKRLLSLKEVKSPNIAFLPLVTRHPGLVPKLASNILKAALGRPVLRSLEASVTDECPGSCPHCFAANRTPSGRPLAIEEWGVVIREALDLGAFMVQFSGGEPLMRTDLEKIISLVPPDSALSVLTTSGFGLDRHRLLNLARAGLDVLVVSLESAVPETHDSFRGLDGCFHQAVSALKHARELGMATIVNFMVTRKRLLDGTARNVLALARSMDAVLNVFLPVELGRWQQPADDFANGPGSSRARRELLDLLAARGVRWCGLSSYADNECGAGREKLTVQADGEVCACSVLPEPVLGNVRDMTLAEIWRCARNNTFTCPAGDIAEIAKGGP